MSMQGAVLVARYEFYKMLRHPLVWVSLAIAIVLAGIHALGYTVILPSFESEMPGSAFIIGVGNSASYTSILTTFLALSIGLCAISGERTNSSIRVLLTKPVYRRDVIMGKILGLGAFLSLMVIAILLFSLSSILISFGGPASSDDVEKALFFGIILIVYGLLTLGIAILIGLIFKDLLLSLIVGVLYIYFSRTSDIIHFLDGCGQLSLVNPNALFGATIVSNDIFLFNPAVSFASWICSSGPYLVLMVAVTIAIFLVSCFLFNFEDV